MRTGEEVRKREENGRRGVNGHVLEREIYRRKEHLRRKERWGKLDRGKLVKACGFDWMA